MAYKISGTKTETGRIIVVDESDFSVEKTVLIEGSGDYEVEVTEGKKTILARSVSGETLGWGNIDPTEILGIMFSDPEVFNSANTSYISVTSLTDTKAIVCYSGTSCILDISGSTITSGNGCTFNSGATTHVSVTKLTDTKAIVCYRDAGNSSYGTACVLDVSGSTITAGNEFVFNSGYTELVSVVKLTDTKAIVCCRDVGYNDYGTACVLNINGFTISKGGKYTFSNKIRSSLSMSALTETKVVVCYDDYYDDHDGIARILNINVSTISRGSEYIFNSGYTFNMSVTGLTETKAIVCYLDYATNRYGKTCVLDVDGTTITVGNEYVFNSGYTYYTSVTKLTETKAIVCYQDRGNNSYATACVLDISGSTITADEELVFNNSISPNVSVTSLTGTKAIVCYRDDGNNFYGTAKLISNIS